MKNRSIGIVMMTYFSGRSFKASQMPEIIHELSKNGQLGKSFGLPYPLDKTVYSKDDLKFLKRSWLCRICFAVLSKFSKHIVPVSHIYQKNEVIYGIFAKLYYNRRNVPEVVIMKPRPAFLVKYMKKLGAEIIVEASENHTRFTCEQVKKEAEAVGASLDNNNYTRQKAIVDYEKGIKFSDGLICLSEFSKKTYVDRGFCEKKIRTIPLNLEVELIEPSFKELELCFVTVAMHSILKGTHRLIKVWRDYQIKSKLIVVGPLDAELQDVIDKLGPVENVEYWGYKSYEFMREFYSTHRSVGILLSFSESFGRTIYECMSTSTPVIVTPYCTLDMVLDGVNGHIVNPENEEDIFSVINLFENMSGRQFFEYQKNVYQTMKDNKIDFGETYVKMINELTDTRK